MPPKIGFLGLGIMGTAMAGNLVKAGLPVTVYNRTAAKAAGLVAAGAGLAATPLSLAAETDILIAMVTGPEALDALLWGEQGAAAAFSSAKTFINMSSVPPRYTLALAEELAPLGVTFIDAPVSGTKKPAEEGKLVILAGGDQDKIAALEPIFQVLGQKVVYCGPVGQGSMMKMAINLLLGAMMTGLAESLNFAQKNGLAPEALFTVIGAGALNCGLFQMKKEMLLMGAYPPNFPLKHMTKDLKFIIDTAYDCGAPVPLAHAALQLCRAGVGFRLGEADFAAVYQVLERMNSREERDGPQ
ncbi:MAG: NAD(P)-dependent oxidoreductase [Desulfobacca sp.]|uniref:NAD(P)-dependent oxidoreductase n=1 Tax=Desulfobacca sp. TaxID=2067990 RepID=UPI00404A567C